MPGSAPGAGTKPVTSETRILWGPALFKTGPDLDHSCPDVIDVTGRLRILVFGPMQFLTGGAWRLTVQFAVNGPAARYPYIVQFIHGDSLVEATVQPARSGTYEVSLDNHFALDAVAALRLWLGRAAFDGDLIFMGARVEALAEPPPESELKRPLAPMQVPVAPDLKPD